MTTKTIAAALVSAAVAFAGQPTWAATPAPAAPAPVPGSSPSLGGPVIPGLCLLSQEVVVSRSQMGLAGADRLRQLNQQVNAELAAEKGAIESDAKALEGKRASLSAADFQAKQRALGQRAQNLQAKAQTRERQLDATRAKVIGQIVEAAQPVVADAYQTHGCGLLLSREAVVGGNMANDLTAAVVTGLDAKVTTMTFNLEPPQTSAPAAH